MLSGERPLEGRFVPVGPIRGNLAEPPLLVERERLGLGGAGLGANTRVAKVPGRFL